MYLFDRKRLAEFLRSGLPDRFLHMEIMLGHVNIRMAHNALNRGQIHSQRLHLADVCVAARMRRQHPNIGDAIQICLEGVAKICWVAGLPYLPHLCSNFSLLSAGVPFAKMGRHGYWLKHPVCAWRGAGPFHDPKQK